MSDIKLFNVSNDLAQELQGTSIAIEKTLQALIENHLEVFLGVRFLSSEYPTGKTHGGRIDTLGINNILNMSHEYFPSDREVLTSSGY